MRLFILFILVFCISCDNQHHKEPVVSATNLDKISLSLSKDQVSPLLIFDNSDDILVHKNLNTKSCGQIIGDINNDGKITKTGTFLLTFNPAEKKYYVLLARKNKQGEIHAHDPLARPPYFGSIIVNADRWGKWVSMGGGYDFSCAGKSSLCAAQKEIEDEAHVPLEMLKKIVFLDCHILREKPETALFVAYLDWENAKKLVENKNEKLLVGLQTKKTKDLGKNKPYCEQYQCELMHLFALDNITPSRKDLIDSSHHEIGYIKWVELDKARDHELLMDSVKNSMEKFLFAKFIKNLENNIYK